MYDGPIHPLRLPRGQDTSLMEWVPYREIYLSVLHDMEAPPNPRRGGQEHSLRTTLLDCLQYLKVGFIMHLGHGGKPCPCGGYPGCNISPSMEDEWEDMDTAGHPPHLARPEGHSCLTIVNVNGVHYCNVQYCNCDGTEGSQLQLLRAGLFPVTIKIWRMTSSTFPHLVPDRYRELLRVSRAWRNLKLLKWKGFYPRSCNLDCSGLVLFCPTCPQPGINIPEMDDVELSHWKYSCVIVMDGNFKAEHMAPKNVGNETWLMDGQGYMVASQDYKTYLGGTKNRIMHSDCNNHHAISQANHHRGQLASMGIGGCACARHGCFTPHSMVDFQKGKHQNLGHQIATNPFLSIPQGIKIQPGIGIWHVHGHKTECFTRYAPNFILGSGNVDGEIMETLWSTLNVILPSTWGMATPHRQEVLDFQMNDSNFLKMIRMHESNNFYIQATCWTNPAIAGALQKKYKAAQKCEVATEEAFTSLNDTLPNELQEQWEQEEQATFLKRTDDPRAMDIFDVPLQKGIQPLTTTLQFNHCIIVPTIKSIEIDLIHAPKLAWHPQGSATWIACRLSIEEAQVSLACESRHNISGDTEAWRLMISHQRDRLLSHINGFVQLSAKFILCNWNDHMDKVNYSKGLDYQVDPDTLEAMELPLPSYLGAAKCQELGLDILQQEELQLQQGQANDALHQLRLALADKNYTMTSWAWKKVSDMDALRCRNQMMSLGADGPILAHYQTLEPEHLNVTTAVANPNTHGHRHKHLAWFWTMDIPKDTCANDWMSKCQPLAGSKPAG
ncbi:hypothetical protein EDC04DRAFT_2605145 [Pisolithus marmoratus]|nr:hypothetical protein EDC04DRAFT_2605145 [Pisolithus marmoratus]